MIVVFIFVASAVIYGGLSALLHLYLSLEESIGAGWTLMLFMTVICLLTILVIATRYLKRRDALTEEYNQLLSTLNDAKSRREQLVERIEALKAQMADGDDEQKTPDAKSEPEPKPKKLTEAKKENRPRYPKTEPYGKDDSFLKHLAIAGIQFMEQSAVCAVKSGDRLCFAMEPENEHDENAVKILHGENHVGYIPQTDSAWTSVLMRDKNELYGIVTTAAPDRLYISFDVWKTTV